MNGNPLPSPIEKIDKIWQDSELSIIGLFAEGKFRFRDELILSAGLRSDFVFSAINDPEEDFLELYGGKIEDQEEINLSGHMSLIRKTGNTQTQLAIGRGVRTASIMERYINHFNVGQDPYEYVGNPYLLPEVNYQAEFSMNHSQGDLIAGGTVFYSYLQDYITALVDENLPRKYMPMMEPRFAKRFVNVDRAMQFGIELFLNYRFSEELMAKADMSYTYGQNKTLDEPLPMITPLTGHLSLKYEREKYWINTGCRLVAEQNRIAESFGETETPGFATFDLSVGYSPIEAITIGASVLNIFDQAYYEHLNFSYINSDQMEGRILEPGRNFTIYANYNF